MRGLAAKPSNELSGEPHYDFTNIGKKRRSGLRVDWMMFEVNAV